VGAQHDQGINLESIDLGPSALANELTRSLGLLMCTLICPTMNLFISNCIQCRARLRSVSPKGDNFRQILVRFAGDSALNSDDPWRPIYQIDYTDSMELSSALQQFYELTHK